MSALNKQVAGSHYKDCAIQPVEYIHSNGIGYFEGNVIKYVTRWKSKNGIADLEKAKHYIELLIELENNNEREQVIKAAETKSDWIKWDGREIAPVTSLTQVEVLYSELFLGNTIQVGGCGEASKFDWSKVTAYKRMD